MISEEEKQRYVEASKCEDCVSWHKYCKSECCSYIFLNIDPKALDAPGRFLSINPGKLGLSDIKYYANRDVNYLRGFLRFRKDRIETIGNRVIYFYACKRLDGDLCLDHPDKKPELCKALTLETAKIPGQPFALTDNCLFKYKCKEVKKDD